MNMNMKINWFPLAVFGALIYGTFSALFLLVPEKIKQDEQAQIGYALMIVLFSLPVNLIILSLINAKSPVSLKNVWKHTNWILFSLIIIINIIYNPLHSLIVNTGGSLGQETTYTLAIIPVLLGSWYFLNERLTNIQWVGIAFAAAGTFLMDFK